jgi:hypothetical protein
MPPRADNAAPVSGNLPPGNSQMASVDDQAPPMANAPASAPGSDAALALCTAGCSLPVEAPCVQESAADCVAWCMEVSVEADACSAEWIALLQCIVGQGQLACDADDDGGESVPPSACDATSEAFDDCVGQLDEAAGGDCTLEGGCICSDACEACLCAVGDSSDTCDILCE